MLGLQFTAHANSTKYVSFLVAVCKNPSKYDLACLLLGNRLASDALISCAWSLRVAPPRISATGSGELDGGSNRGPVFSPSAGCLMPDLSAQLFWVKLCPP